MSDQITGRLDPSSYHPVRRSVLDSIQKSSFEILPLDGVVDFHRELVSEIPDGLPYLGLKNVESNTGKYRKGGKEEVCSAFLFSKGEVLFPKLRPYLNKVFYADFDGACSTEFHVLQSKKCDPFYLFTYLNSSLTTQQTKYLMTGNTLPRLQTEDINNLQIVIPPKSIQEKIVTMMQGAYEQKQNMETEAGELLGSIDGYVLGELGIEMPEVENEMTFTVWSDEITGRLDPHFYQPELKKYDGIFEKHGSTLKEVSKKITSGATPKSGGDDYVNKKEGIPFVRSGEIKPDKYINFDKTLYVKNEVHRGKLKSSQLKKGDVLIAIVGATIGQVSVYNYDREANINQAIALVRLNDEVDPEFVKEYLLTDIGQNELNKIKRPVARANINLDEIGSIRIPLLTKPAQEKIIQEAGARRSRARELQVGAREVLDQARTEVEEMILG